MIEPVPRAEVERLFPHLKGKPLWGEQESYDPAKCKEFHWIVYGPVEPMALVQATRLFKSASIVNKGETK